MGRRGYPPEFRRRVLDLLTAGRKVVDLARDLGVSDQTIYTWRRQEQIDRGLVAGLRSGEREELAAAHQRIRELQAELEVHPEQCCDDDDAPTPSDRAHPSRSGPVLAQEPPRALTSPPPSMR